MAGAICQYSQPYRRALDVGRGEGWRVRDASSVAAALVVARPALPPLGRVRGIALEAGSELAILFVGEVYFDQLTVFSQFFSLTCTDPADPQL